MREMCWFWVGSQGSQYNSDEVLQVLTVLLGRVFQVTVYKSHRQAFILMDTPALFLSPWIPDHMLAAQREDFITRLLPCRLR